MEGSSGNVLIQTQTSSLSASSSASVAAPSASSALQACSSASSTSSPSSSSFSSSSAESATSSPPPDPLFVLRGHLSPVNIIRFLPHSISSVLSQTPQLLSAAANGEIRIWNLQSRRCDVHWNAEQVEKDEAKNNGNKSLSHAANGGILNAEWIDSHHVITQGKSGLIKLWNTGQLAAPVLFWPTESYSFCRMCILPVKDSNSVLVLTGSETASNATLWKLTPLSPSASTSSSIASVSSWSHCLVHTFECEARLPAREIPPFAENMDQNDMKELQILLENAMRDAPIQYEKKYGMMMCCKLLSVDKEIFLVCGMESGHLQIHWIKQRTPLAVLQIHRQTLLNFDIRPVNSSSSSPLSSSTAQFILVSGSASNNIAVVSVTLQSAVSESSQWKAEIEMLSDIVAPHDGIADVCIRSDAKLFASGGWDRRVRFFSLPDIQPLSISSSSSSASSFSPSSFSSSQCEALATLRYHSDVVYSVAFAEDWNSGLFASAGKDQRIALYQIYGKSTSQVEEKGKLLLPASRYTASGQKKSQPLLQ